MKPILSDNGTVELMFGVLGIIGGLVAGDHPFTSGTLFAIGVGLTIYGLGLRKQWNDRIKEPVQRLPRVEDDKG